MPAKILTPATLSYRDGIPYSIAYDDVYHARKGAAGQTRYVFMGGNNLPERWRQRATFTILETGFGMGQNFLTTWQAWRNDPHRSDRLHFISIEKHPFRQQDLVQLYQGHSELADIATDLIAQWPPLTPGFHRLLLDGGRVVLTLVFDDIADALVSLEARVDAFYLDGFAPAKNPDMWSKASIAALPRLARPGATFATYTVARQLQDNLQAAGFLLEKRPGYAGKREMLCGCLSGVATASALPRQATVIGAGLAGAALSYSLAQRGVSVHLIDAHPAPAQATSGNPAGILMPVVSVDDNPSSRLTRAGFLYSRRLLALLPLQEGIDWLACGVLQVARDSDNAAWQDRVLAAHAYPAEYLHRLDQAEASDQAGVTLPAGGLYFPQGAVVSPPALCQALINAHPQQVRQSYGITVQRIDRCQGKWQAFDTNGTLVSESDVLLLAMAGGITGLAQAAHLPLQHYRGQLSWLSPKGLTVPRMALCRDGYLAPPLNGVLSFGATYDRDEELAVRPQSHWANLEKLQQILPDLAQFIDPAALAGRAGIRATAPDRLPLAGPLFDETMLDGQRPFFVQPRLPHLYCLTGLASRGLAWAPLLAEYLAARISGEPSPVDKVLADAVDPVRFKIRQLQKGR